jgi:hypothetical protein
MDADHGKARRLDFRMRSRLVQAHPPGSSVMPLDMGESVHLTGETNSLDLPTPPGAAQPGNAGGRIPRGAFVVKIQDR